MIDRAVSPETGRGLRDRRLPDAAPSGAGSRIVGALVVLALTLVLTGCVRGCPSGRPPIHLNPNMDNQPKARPQSGSEFFYDGMTMRQPVPGTVARGELTDDSPYFTGLDADGQPVVRMPVEATAALLERGAQRYTIYCQPCHDPKGYGKGILFQRGKVPTTSFHDPRLLDVGDGHIFGVITNGQGLMPAYRWPIPVADRWAIVAHVRKLQGRLPTAAGTDVAEAR